MNIKLDLKAVIHSIAVHSNKDEESLMEQYMHLKAAGIKDLAILESMVFNNDNF